MRSSVSSLSALPVLIERFGRFGRKRMGSLEAFRAVQAKCVGFRGAQDLPRHWKQNEPYGSWWT